MNNKKNKLIIIGGIIGLIFGIVAILGLENDNFLFVYAAPYYIQSYLFGGTVNQSLAILAYFSLVGILIGYLNNLPKNKPLIVSSVILLHIVLTVIGVRAISKDIKEFLTNMPVETMVNGLGEI